MSKLKLQAPAKINLGLSITGKRPDGYHNLKTVFCQISLFDQLTIGEIGDGVMIDCDNSTVPIDERNTVYKAINILKTKYNVKKGVEVSINKNIPVEAGLGGGSSDAAATILGLNKLWNLGLTTGELIEIALKIGADVPYPIVGGTKLATGVGEIFEDLPPLSGVDLVVCVPDFGVSTKWAFSHVNYEVIGKGGVDTLIKAIKERDIETIASNLHNDLEYWVLKRYPIIAEIKKRLLDYGALGAVMTGTGSGAYGIFDNDKKKEWAFKTLKNDYKNTFMVETL